MNKLDSKNRVQAIRDYLEAIGSPISSVQGYEVLARALGFKNKHVMSANLEQSTSQEVASSETLPEKVKVGDDWVQVMRKDAGPCDPAVMEALDWTFDIIVPVPLDVYRESDVDAQNDYVSKRITGNETALEDIGYAHVPEVNYGEGFVAIRVTGYVSSPQDFFEVQDPEEVKFYADMSELLGLLSEGRSLERASQEEGSAVFHVTEVNVSALNLLTQYATGQGANNEEVNDFLDTTVCRLKNSTTIVDVTVDMLKYATKIGPSVWHMSVNSSAVFFRF